MQLPSARLALSGRLFSLERIVPSNPLREARCVFVCIY